MKRVLSGIQPSGDLTIGNYIGAIKNIVKLQKEYDSFIFVANLHALTTHPDPSALTKNTINLAKMLIACGVDTKKTTLFVQSDIKTTLDIAHVMLCYSTMDELKNMTQFKDKSLKINKKDNNTVSIPAGLFTYPALQAADILSYNPDFVPVGKDQKQHLELTKKLAKRINANYGKIFKIPKIYLNEQESKIMSLTDPSKKMSKSSQSAKSYILLNDDLDLVKKKIMSAQTDSEGKVYFDLEKKPGISNLITIYAAMKNINIKDAEAQLKDLDYKTFKEKVASKVCDVLAKIQAKAKKIQDDEVLLVLKNGAKKANKVSLDIHNKLMKATGLKYEK